MVRAWYTSLAKQYPSTAAGSYRLLASILRAAVDDEVLVRTPCRLRGAGRERSSERPIASVSELEAGIAACPEHFQLAPMLAAWCQLRRGEILGLQRQDIDLDVGTLTIRRSWCLQHNGSSVMGPPKTEAGIRTVSIPPNVLPMLQSHMKAVGRKPTAWLFPGENEKPVSPRSVDRVWDKARQMIGRPDLRFHDLRHTGLTLTAIAGATTAELMRRAGHASPAAAIRYQHATTDRDKALAQALGELAESANVIALRRTKDGRNRTTRADEQAG